MTSLAAIALFTVIMIAANALRDMLSWISEVYLSVWDVCRLFSILVPSVISYALPLGMMTGILLVIGKMSSQNELLVLKDAGLSLRQITSPIFWLAGAASLFSIYINLYHAPASIETYRQSFSTLLRKDPMRFIHPKTFNDHFPGYIIYVDNFQDGYFQNMRVWQYNNQTKNLELYLFAHSGTIVFDKDAEAFFIKLRTGSMEKIHHSPDPHVTPPPQIVFFEDTQLRISAQNIFSNLHRRHSKLSHMTLPQLLQRKKEINAQKDTLPYSEIRIQKNLINMQISTHLANAIGIIVMAILAVPLGIKSNRSESAISMSIAFALCLGYYFSMIIFSWFGMFPRVRPDLLIWIPNIVLLSIGCVLFHRASQH